MPELDGRVLAINRRTYPSAATHSALDAGEPVDGFVMRQLQEQATVTVVLVSGAIGDYAAYVGFGVPEWVARFGDKLSFEEARCHFPGIEEKRYRL